METENQNLNSAHLPDERSGHKWVRVLLVITILLIFFVGLAAWFIADKNSVKTANTPVNITRIGLSLDTLKESRWSTDEADLIKYAKVFGGTITAFVANSNDSLQVSQIENLIAQRVQVLIIVAHNPEAVAPTIAMAHAAGIKVIAYDRMITNSNVDYYDSYDSTKVGMLEAQYVMNAVPKSIPDPSVMIVDGSPTDNNATL
ncbi:MAG TPA: substrate-binding domain-containing protein, partial [Candidatus Saccharimonadales bacterium]|nr:substrate-binding domain-containing protein [Candidatus Saccharimonadales bacterium]